MVITQTTIFFFDMDGTLVNTDIANFLSYKSALAIVTGENTTLMSSDPFERLNRSRLKSIIPGLTATDYERIIREKEICYKKYLHKTTIIKKNVEVLLRYSPTHQVVLVSNCRKKRALETLAYHGLLDKFTNVFYRDAASNKQRTNKYQNAINQLNLPPENIVVFENDRQEIADAMDAGIRIINPQILL